MRYKVQRNEWGAVPKDLSGVDTGFLRVSLVCTCEGKQVSLNGVVCIRSYLV